MLLWQTVSSHRCNLVNLYHMLVTISSFLLMYLRKIKCIFDCRVGGMTRQVGPRVQRPRVPHRAPALGSGTRHQGMLHQGPLLPAVRPLDSRLRRVHAETDGTRRQKLTEVLFLLPYIADINWIY